MESDRIWSIKSRLFAYVESPSLKHIRDPNSVHKLAKEILVAVDQAGSLWRKWDGPRDEAIKNAASCWIPVEDLHAFLNQLPGPELTATDVKQRLRAIWEEAYNRYPNEDVKDGCLALYERERAAGTEMMAIIGAINEFIEAEEERLRVDGEARYRQFREDERIRQGRCSWPAPTCPGSRSALRKTSFVGRTVDRFESRRARTDGGACFGSRAWMMPASWLACMGVGATRTRR